MRLYLTKKNFGLHNLMILPALILFIVFFMIPIIQGLILSFTDWDGFSEINFIGLENFKFFFSDERAINSVVNTLIFGASGTILLNIFGLLYALLLDTNLRMNGVVRTLVYIPNIISPLIMGYIWMLILSSENGVLLATSKVLNLPWLFHDWLASPKAAIVVIILISLWQGIGGNMMIYLAGLQNISSEVHEAAVIDGSNYFQELFYIKIPLLGPSIRINLVTNIIGCMSIFDIIMSLTGGGPGFYTESLSLFIYKQSTSGNAGYSSAVAIILFLIILLPVTISFIATKRMEVDA